MSGVDDAVEFAARGSRDDLQAHAKLRLHSAESTERHPVNAAVLQARHERCRDSRPVRQIVLTQATLDASCPKCQAEAKILHWRQDGPGRSPRAYLAISPQCIAEAADRRAGTDAGPVLGRSTRRADRSHVDTPCRPPILISDGFGRNWVWPECRPPARSDRPSQVAALAQPPSKEGLGVPRAPHRAGRGRVHSPSSGQYRPGGRCR